MQAAQFSTINSGRPGRSSLPSPTPERRRTKNIGCRSSVRNLGARGDRGEAATDTTQAVPAKVPVKLVGIGAARSVAFNVAWIAVGVQTPDDQLVFSLEIATSARAPTVAEIPQQHVSSP